MKMFDIMYLYEMIYFVKWMCVLFFKMKIREIERGIDSVREDKEKRKEYLLDLLLLFFDGLKNFLIFYFILFILYILCLYLILLFVSEYFYQTMNIDGNRLKVEKEEIVDLLVKKNIFDVLNHVIIEEKINDKEFLVCLIVEYIILNLGILFLLLLL